MFSPQSYASKALLLLLSASSALGAPSAGCGKEPTLESGTQTLDINGTGREYILRIPEGYNSTNPYKLIFGIHWLGGTAEDVDTGQTVEEGVWSYYGLQDQAQGSAIFVAPNGIDGNWYNEGGSDMALFDEIVSQVEEDLCVDDELRFSIGFSWGGAMSYALACRDDPYTFRAVTCIAAAGPYTCEPGTSPRAYLGIHGISDRIEEGHEMRDRWLENNGCDAEEAPEPEVGSLTHTKTEYTCDPGYPVTWIAFDGGHTPAPWDGGEGDNGSESFVPLEAWAFFNQF